MPQRSDGSSARLFARRRDGHISVARAVAQFAVTGVAALVLLGFAGVRLLQHTGTTEAINDSKNITRLIARGIVAPYLTPALLRGDPRAVAAVDRVVHTRVLEEPVVRVKVWDGSGRIVYSDRHALIGTAYHLGEDEERALRTGGVDAEVSNLARPENRFERKYGKLLEVYLGVRTTAGARVLFEVYQRFSSVSANGDRLLRAFAPALIGALLVLELAQIPLAWSLARRFRRSQQEREALLQRAIDASDTERRRIARDLHDGVVQNLAGIAYSLSAAAEELRGNANGAAAPAALEHAADQARASVRELRSVLVDIYPPNLHQEGLEAALSDLLASLAARDIRTSLSFSAGPRLPEATEAVLFRVAQEAIRNAAEHSGARRVDVTVEAGGGRAVLAVADDGGGFVRTGSGSPEGHFGLRMLDDVARESGGTLELDSEPGRGTRVTMEVPLP